MTHAIRWRDVVAVEIRMTYGDDWFFDRLIPIPRRGLVGIAASYKPSWSLT